MFTRLTNPSAIRSAEAFEARLAAVHGDRITLVPGQEYLGAGTVDNNLATTEEQKLKVKCVCGHQWGVRPDNVLQGRSCPACKHKRFGEYRRDKSRVLVGTTNQDNVTALDIKFEWLNNKSKKGGGCEAARLRCRCPHCGNEEWWVHASNFQTPGHSTKCPDCAERLNGLRDSPQRFKEDTAYAISLASFYLASVHWDEFVKVGIAKDFWARTNQDKTHDTEHRSYTCPLFISQKYPRPWVWTAEQIILQETKHLQGVVPEEWSKWVGASELRTFMLDTDQVVLRFYELMEEVSTEGWEAVYDTYMELETVKVPEVNYDILQVTVNQHMLKTRAMVEKVLALSH